MLFVFRAAQQNVNFVPSAVWLPQKIYTWRLVISGNSGSKWNESSNFRLIRRIDYVWCSFKLTKSETTSSSENVRALIRKRKPTSDSSNSYISSSCDSVLGMTTTMYQLLLFLALFFFPLPLVVYWNNKLLFCCLQSVVQIAIQIKTFDMWHYIVVYTRKNN